MAVSTGDQAPAFTLPGIHDGERRDYTLAEFAGRPVVLAFYPGDNTPVCTKQLCAYTSDLDAFAELDAQVIGISPQSVDSHEGFAAKQSLGMPLLADEAKDAAKAYGVLGIAGQYRRAVFVVDGSGAISYAHVAPLVGVTFKPSSALLDAIRAAQVA